MIIICAKCGDRFNDEHVSTVCPHKGIGYCRKCDCVICVCPPAPTEGRGIYIREGGQICQTMGVKE